MIDNDFTDEDWENFIANSDSDIIALLDLYIEITGINTGSVKTDRITAVRMLDLQIEVYGREATTFFTKLKKWYHKSNY
jgi:hypothetical protein